MYFRRLYFSVEPTSRRLLGDPLSAKLRDLFGRLGCFLLFVRCAFYYGTIFIIFIGAHSSGFRGLAWSTPQTPRAPPALLVGGAMEADACKHNGSAPGSAPHPVYVHLLFYLACSHFAATICRHNKLPIIFSFHISVIDFAARRRAKSKGAGENSYPMPETICFINHENWIDRAKRNLPLILIVIHRARARLKFLSRRASRASSSTSIFRRN